MSNLLLRLLYSLQLSYIVCVYALLWLFSVNSTFSPTTVCQLCTMSACYWSNYFLIITFSKYENNIKTKPKPENVRQVLAKELAIYIIYIYIYIYKKKKIMVCHVDNIFSFLFYRHHYEYWHCFYKRYASNVTILFSIFSIYLFFDNAVMLGWSECSLTTTY